MQEMRIQSLGLEVPLKKEMANDSSILAWKIPWTEEPGGLTQWVVESDTCMFENCCNKQKRKVTRFINVKCIKSLVPCKA